MTKKITITSVCQHYNDLNHCDIVFHNHPGRHSLTLLHSDFIYLYKQQGYQFNADHIKQHVRFTDTSDG